MPAIAPSGPGEVVAPKDSSVEKIIQRFKDAKDGNALNKSVPKAPEKPAAIAPAQPPPAPVPTPEKPNDKSIVPKLEPLPEKKVDPVKPTEPAKPEGEPIPEKLSHKNFKEVLAARDEFRTKYEAAEKRAKEIEAKLQEQSTRTPPELEETKKLLAEKDHFISQFMLEQSDEFQNAFTRPIEQAILDAKDVVGGEKGDRLAEILKAPDGKWRTDQIKAFVGELEDDYEKGVVRDSVNALRKLERSRKDELAKAGTNIQALKQMHLKRQEEQAVQQKEMRSKLVQSSLNEATRAFEDFRETDDAGHNSVVVENRAMLQQFLSDELPPHELGRMAAWAVRGFRSLTERKQLTEKISTLEAEIAKLSSASPDLDGGGSGSEVNGGKADTPEKMGARFTEAIQRGVPGQ